jgi:site-specific recombinase XerD
MIYREAIRNGWLESNPARLIRAKKEENGRIRFLSDEEETRLRKVIAAEYPDTSMSLRWRFTPGCDARNNSRWAGTRAI